MTPQQIATELAAKRTDAPTPYALTWPANVPRDMQALVARTFHAVHHHAEPVDAQIVLRALEDDPIPADLTERILNALKEIRDDH